MWVDALDNPPFSREKGLQHGQAEPCALSAEFASTDDPWGGDTRSTVSPSSPSSVRSIITSSSSGPCDGCTSESGICLGRLLERLSLTFGIGRGRLLVFDVDEAKDEEDEDSDTTLFSAPTAAVEVADKFDAEEDATADAEAAAEGHQLSSLWRKTSELSSRLVFLLHHAPILQAQFLLFGLVL